MNRSFVFGIIFASITWTISLYLYWSLTEKSNQFVPNNGGGDAVVGTEKTRDQFHAANLNDISNSIKGNKILDKKSLFMDKIERYEKKKKFRKISQKLLQELQPIPINGTGNSIRIYNQTSVVHY